MNKQDNSKKLNISSANKPVRLFYTIAIDCVIQKPSGKKCSDDEWYKEECENLATDLEEKLPDFDSVVFTHYERYSPGRQFFTVHFDVSKLHLFDNADFFIPRGSYWGFKVRPRPLLSVDRLIQARLYESLCRDYQVSQLSFKFATSRVFEIEMYFEGEIVVEHEFTPDEIREAGSISEALEQFFGDVVSGYPERFELTPLNNVSRRRADNKYTFSVYTRRTFSFRENEFDGGDFTRIGREGSEADSEIQIDTTVEAHNSCVSSIKDELKYIDDEVYLPDDSDVISSDIGYVDHSDDYSWSDELLPRYKK
jgi:hypothetical protein